MDRGRLSPQLLFQLLLIDTIGTLLFFLGLYDGFLASEPLMPERLAFDGYAYVLLVVGVSLQIPTVVVLVLRRGRNLME